MANSSPPTSPGGFFPPATSILSPPPSSLASTTAHTSLPQPRAHPLRPGGAKESQFIRFVDQSLLQIQRRYAIRGGGDIGKIELETGNQRGSRNGDEERGYKTFGEVVVDVERVLDLIWVSGTPSLQIPYLLTLAPFVTQYLPSFQPSQKSTFRILGKFDLAFASLLQGRDVETGEALPGFDTGKKVSGTEKVRMKSLVEQTRIVVMDVIGNAGELEVKEDDGGGEETDFDVETDVETGDEMDVDTDGDGAFGGGYGVDDFGETEMGVARVYDRTIVELGDTIGGSLIGIITDD